MFRAGSVTLILLHNLSIHPSSVLLSVSDTIVITCWFNLFCSVAIACRFSSSAIVLCWCWRSRFCNSMTSRDSLHISAWFIQSCSNVWIYSLVGRASCQHRNFWRLSSSMIRVVSVKDAVIASVSAHKQTSSSLTSYLCTASSMLIHFGIVFLCLCV